MSTDIEFKSTVTATIDELRQDGKVIVLVDDPAFTHAVAYTPEQLISEFEYLVHRMNQNLNDSMQDEDTTTLFEHISAILREALQN